MTETRMSGRRLVGLVAACVLAIGCGGSKGSGTGSAGTTGTAGTGGGGAGTTGAAGGGGTTGDGGNAGTAGTSGSAGASGSSGHAGSGGASGGTGGAALGCQTSVAPTVALISDFAASDGGTTVIAGGVPGGIFTNAPMNDPAPTPTVMSGAWNVNYVAVASAETDTVKFGIYFSPPGGACVDAHTYSGVSFKISGTISGCTLQGLIADSEETSHTDDPTRGGCTVSSCQASQKDITLQTSPTATQIAWGDAAGGSPAGTIDATRLTSIGWQLTIPPAPDGGNGACIADITIDDVMFY